MTFIICTINIYLVNYGPIGVANYLLFATETFVTYLIKLYPHNNESEEADWEH